MYAERENQATVGKAITFSSLILTLKVNIIILKQI